MDIHARGKEIAQRFHRSYIEIIEFLIELEETRAFKDLRHPSITVYAEKEFRLTNNKARSLARVARKSMELPQLRDAIQKERVTVSKVEKVASQLNNENVVEVIDYLEKHSIEKTLDWLGRDQEIKINMSLALRIVDKFRHAQSNIKEDIDLEKTFEVVVDEFNERRDPVRKAERARDKRLLAAERPASPKRKRQYPAALKHTLILRDQRRCCYHDDKKERCEYKKFVDFHHIVKVSEGGLDTLENLITLCSAHHKIVHEQQIPRSVQREWQAMV